MLCSSGVHKQPSIGIESTSCMQIKTKLDAVAETD